MEITETASFWKGKTVFLTGHTGFKGSWLSLWLKFLGAKVTGFSLPPSTNPNLFELCRTKEKLSHQEADIRHFDILAQAIQKSSPEIVIHMAAQPLVRESYKTPLETYATNTLGTVHILEAVRQFSVPLCLIVTTDKCYENNNRGIPFTESDPLGGADPYSNSKACAELVTSAYNHSFFKDSKTRIASARAGNVIGGGDFSIDRLIP